MTKTPKKDYQAAKRAVADAVKKRLDEDFRRATDTDQKPKK